MQLDIFEHNREVLLKNAVLAALEQRDATGARCSLGLLVHEYPDCVDLHNLESLIKVLETPVSSIQSHQELNIALQYFTDTIAPASLRILGDVDGRKWMEPVWKNLALCASALPFDSKHGLAHSAPIYLRVADWQAAVAAVQSIESWRRKPVPLSWMLQANLALTGLQANLGLLAELAWMSPRRLAQLAGESQDALLRKLASQFETGFAGFEQEDDWAWFPAWLLTERPHLSAMLTLAQASSNTPAEQAMRCLITLLGLERQGGRHPEIVQERKHLKGLNEALFLAYIRLR